MWLSMCLVRFPPVMKTPHQLQARSCLAPGLLDFDFSRILAAFFSQRSSCLLNLIVDHQFKQILHYAVLYLRLTFGSQAFFSASFIVLSVR
jgi:hypothetical protein